MITFRCTLLAATSAVLAAAVHAQEPVPADLGSRWRHFVGCWVPPQSDGRPTLVCIIPTEKESAVELLTVVADSIVERESIDAAGPPRPFQRDGCTGAQSTRFGTPAHTFLMRAHFTCDRNAPQSTSSIVSLNASGDLSRVEGITTASYRAVRTTAYRPVLDPAVIPASIVARLRTAGIDTPRTASRHALVPADVIDAAAFVDGHVVEAWLADRRESMRFSVSDLKRMRQANVPAGAIDMMIALADTSTFRIAQVTQRARQASDPAGGGQWLGTSAGSGFFPSYAMMLYPGTRAYGWNSAVRSWRQVNQNDGWIVGNQSLTISPAPQAASRASGRVVSGRGYSQGYGTDAGTAMPRSSGSAGSGGTSSGGSNDGGRTARARP